MAALALLVGIILYSVGAAAEAQKLANENRNSLTGLAVDIRYIREAVTELKTSVARKP